MAERDSSERERIINRVRFPTIDDRRRFEALAALEGKKGRELLTELAMRYLEQRKNAPL